MRLPILQLIVIFAVVTAIAAVVFRSQRARGMYRFLLKLAYAYIAALIILAGFRLWQMWA